MTRIGSLFSGSGMLDEGVRAVIGGTVAWHAEVEPAACRVLDYRYPGVPNIGDITAVDWAQVEPVDVITGGSPCQDVSAAGKRAGMRAGTRSGLWASMVDAIDVLRPSLVVWENVRGVLSAEADSALERCPGCVGDGDDGAVLRALGRVLGDLAELGYDARWHGLRAADVGAPHGRYRIFVTAHPADGGYAASRASGHAAGLAEPASHHEIPTDAPNLGHERGGVPRGRWTGSADGSRRAAADPDCDGRESVGGLNSERCDADGRSGADVAWGVYEPAIRRWERLTRPAPSPTEIGPKGGNRLSARFTEWMQGWPDGWITDVPAVSRNEALKLCGNGVVPQQAAEAVWQMLTAEAVAA